MTADRYAHCGKPFAFACTVEHDHLNKNGDDCKEDKQDEGRECSNGGVCFGGHDGLR